jgi:DNA-binding NtrC family response regulator
LDFCAKISYHAGPWAQPACHADAFLQEFTTAYGRKPKELTPEAYEALREYHWPGNVRELRNLIERIVILNPQVRIDARHIPVAVTRRSGQERPPDRFGSLQEVREAAEREYIQRKLEEDAARPTMGWRIDRVAHRPFVKNLIPNQVVYNCCRLQETWLDK